MRPWKTIIKRQARLSLKRWILIQALCFLAFLAFSQTKLALDLQRNLSAPLNFKFRTLIKMDPLLDPRIKIFAFDDSTLEYVGREDIGLGEWASLIQGMAKTQPAAIYIDKFFGTPEKLEDEIKHFQAVVETLEVPLVIDVWQTPTAVRGRFPHPLDLDYFDPANRIQAGLDWKKALAWLPVTAGFLYGPHRTIMPMLKQLGHAVYAGHGEIHPLLRLSEDRVVPHWTLIGANHYTLGDQELLVNDQKIPLTDRQSVYVNFLNEEELRKRSISFRSSIARVRKNIAFTEVIIPRPPIIQKGQYIVILPAMFTANTDMVNTPQGYWPGGFVMVSMLNSTLTGEWLKPFHGLGGVLLLLSLLGGLVGVFASPVVWTSALFLGNSLIALLALLSFSYLRLVIPWELLISCFSVSTLITFANELHLKALFERDEKGQREAMHQAAQAVQEALIPNTKGIPAIEVAAYYKAAEATGGDWYGIYTSEDSKRIFIFIGDVTGHGFSSALLTGVVSGGIKTLLKEPSTCTEEPGIILKTMARSINDLVYRTGSKASRSMTMTFACIDLPSNICHFLNGGHCPPYRLQENKINPLVARGDILGFGEHFRGEPKKIELKAGDLLFFYTDGLLENEGPDGTHLKERAIWECLKDPKAPVEDILQAVLVKAHDIWQGHPPEDDCTFFILRYQGFPKPA